MHSAWHQTRTMVFQYLSLFFAPRAGSAPKSPKTGARAAPVPPYRSQLGDEHSRRRVAYLLPKPENISPKSFTVLKVVASSTPSTGAHGSDHVCYLAFEKLSSSSFSHGPVELARIVNLDGCGYTDCCQNDLSEPPLIVFPTGP